MFTSSFLFSPFQLGSALVDIQNIFRAKKKFFEKLRVLGKDCCGWTLLQVQ